MVMAGLLGMGIAIAPLSPIPFLAVRGGAQPAHAQTVPPIVQQGYRLLDEGDVSRAINAFEQAVQAFPNSVEATLGLAIAHRRAGNDEDAFNAYSRVLDLDSDNRLALSAVGLLGGFREEWQVQGIEALTRLLNLDADDASARAQRALLYIYQGQFEAAIQDYNRVLQQDTSPTILVGAAQAYTYSGQYEPAIELFQQFEATGAAFQADEAIAYGIALRETGRAPEAIPILNATLADTGATTAAAARLRGALASAYAANLQVNQALSVLTPLPGRGDSRLILARAYSDLERYTGNPAFLDTAAQWYRLALVEAPELTAGIAREVAGALSIIPGYELEALDVYRQLVQRYPTEISLQVQQVVTEYTAGITNSSELQGRLQSLLQPLPTDEQEQKTIAQTLTRIDPPLPGLLPIYQSVVQLENSDPFLYFRIAQMYSQLGQYETAKQALFGYSSSSAGQRDVYSSLLLLADIERQQGNLDLSAQRYLSILAANVQDTQLITGALQGLAAVRQSQGRVDEAIALYDQIIVLNPQDPTKQLGRIALAYQTDRISEFEATAALSQWLAAQPISGTLPPEVASLVGLLPAAPEREALYDWLLSIDPTSVPIQIRKIQLVAQREPELAQAMVELLVLQNPSDLDFYFVQGEVAQALGDLDSAKDAYEVILSQEPTNIGALQSLGGVQFQRRRLTSAAQLYNRARALEPQNLATRRTLADLSVVRGNRLQAVEDLERIQREQVVQGVYDPDVWQQLQRTREGYLQQRGFQPPWERF